MRVWKRYKRLGTRSVGPHELTLILAPSSLRTADVSPRSFCEEKPRETSLNGDERGETSAVRRLRTQSLQGTWARGPWGTWSSSSRPQEDLGTRTAHSLRRWFFVRLENSNLLSCFIKRSLQWIHVLNCRRLPTASWTMVTTVRHLSWE